MWHVYLLQSLKDKKYYIGQTDDIQKRLKEHNKGKIKSTKSRVPFKLMGCEEYSTQNEARRREYELKKSAWQRKKFFEKFIIFLIIFISIPFIASASITDGTIDSTYKYAWGENTGWINFGTTEGNVHVTDSALTGYIWAENIGWISLNCSNDSSCSTVNYKVFNNGEGTLSGYAWSENTGWINFNPTYGGVTINSSGEFLGYAWGENIGWIVFNCATTNSCSTVDYKVKTDWRPQSARPACNNSLDDDGDGKTDYPNDPGCSSLDDTDEMDAAAAPSGGGGGGLPPGAYNAPVAPSGGFIILIQDGAKYTNSRTVTLKLNGGSDAKKMAISNTGDFTDASQEDYQTQKQWDLCSKLGGRIKFPDCPEGAYTVYVKFYTQYGQLSQIVSDGIIYKKEIIAQKEMKPISELPPPQQLIAGIPTNYRFTTNLKYNQKGANIRYLQLFLKSQEGGIYPEGIISGWFGALTRKAVIRFQEKYASDILAPLGLIKGTGLVGKTTRNKINEILGR